MAITAAQLQTALGANTYGTDPVVIGEYAPHQSASNPPASQYWHIRGGVRYPGQVKMIKTTASDNAATQATTITTALTGAGNSNV